MGLLLPHDPGGESKSNALWTLCRRSVDACSKRRTACLYCCVYRATLSYCMYAYVRISCDIVVLQIDRQTGDTTAQPPDAERRTPPLLSSQSSPHTPRHFTCYLSIIGAQSAPSKYWEFHMFHWKSSHIPPYSFAVVVVVVVGGGGAAAGGALGKVVRHYKVMS